jgi:hypothetical protein
MARRQHITLTLLGVMLFITLTYFMSSGSSSAERYPTRIADETWSPKEHDSSHSASNPASGLSDSILKGGSIAPKLENATAK